MWKFSPFQIDPSTLRPCHLCHSNLIPLKPQIRTRNPILIDPKLRSWKRYNTATSRILKDDEVTRSIYFANAVIVYTNSQKEEPRAGMYCNYCCNLLKVKAAEAAYHDEQMKKGDMVLQCILKQEGIASLCKAYPRDFVTEPGLDESAAGRVGWELYTLINGVILDNSQLFTEKD